MSAVEGVENVSVEMGVMDEDQKKALREKLNGGRPEREIPFSRPDPSRASSPSPPVRAASASLP